MSEKKFQNNLKGHFSGTLMKVEESEIPNGKKVKNCEILMSVGEGEKGRCGDNRGGRADGHPGWKNSSSGLETGGVEEKFAFLMISRVIIKNSGRGCHG